MSGTSGTVRRGAGGWFRVCLVAAAALLALEAAALGQDEGTAPESSQPVSNEARPLGLPASSASTGRADKTAGKAGGIPTSAALGGVLVLAVVAAGVVRTVAKRSGGLGAMMGPGGRAPAGIMEILGRYPVGRGTTLMLLKVDRRVLLLSQSATGRLGMGSTFTTLSEFTDPEEVGSILVKARDAEGDSMAERFRSLLGRFEKSYDAEPASEGRRTRVGRGGDRAEIWDDRTGIPVVDLTQQGESAAAVLRRRLAQFGGGQR